MKLTLNSISKRFDQTVILQDTSFVFEQGKIYGLLGRNGAGKTTLFNCIAHNLVLEQGSIQLEEEGQLRDYDSVEIGFTQTSPQLPGFMTAFEFIRFYMDIHRDRLRHQHSPKGWLELIGIQAADQHRLLKDFSHGMKNKVQLLLSLMVRPTVLLLDEPLTSFDPVAAHEFKHLIREAKKDSIIIFSTHILQLAQDLCDEIVLLHHQSLKAVPTERLHDAHFEQEIVALLTDNEGAL
ncbi:ABC transporter ATP-binding protein [Streptococcus azizii]|uniref:ABC transporter ATP-binding protein n=1 Tax=Streptococcus azizii TaxID=1579424 RepID=A0AB36JP06_9STRE|nr:MULTISPECIES: ABC transporter ATP-binding protein [Streptococcus]MBF0776879.1 ABC transporter ATP-binding protein [Streptococcus sp. 19428wD3_AN2]ONK27051.1 ABC transporter ATP-binding protein [Streptococcus azizii]ONK28404.1 ABC transporter ATP-binding protein [Streptococcus azizii]ONK28484.1 ABC transporter ATP-binding protein [Streptococcus azizii]TFU82233.1 ABC transporter ATP-binding protein [Streptococcus sp. AN2]